MTNKYDFNDILIKPSAISIINSRKEINPYDNGLLPLSTAPMYTVIDKDVEMTYITNKVITCLPRGEANGIYFTAYSLDEIMTKYKNKSCDFI